MQLKYIDKPAFSVEGVKFTHGDVREVTEELGKRLLETFPIKFEDCTPKAEPKTTKRAKVKAEAEDKAE